MISFQFHFFALAIGLCLMVGCVSSVTPASRREELVAQLDLDMRTSSGWVQVHAADALIDHGETNKVIPLFAPIATNPPTQFRVGVWRVMARAAKTREERRVAVERIQSVLRDPSAADRLQAAETLAKIGEADSADRGEVQLWLNTAEEPIVPFLRWLLAISESGQGRALNEAALATLLDSANPITRLRAAVALGRLDSLSQPASERLRAQVNQEPDGSIAKVYVITASLRQTGSDAKRRHELKVLLLPYLTRGQTNEQLEATAILGQYGDPADGAALAGLLQSPDADARIGAASGLLYLMR